MNLPTPRSYSFNVPPNTNFIVIVNGVNTTSSGSYTLDVHGSDCLPRLNITQVATNKVTLDWTTASAGFSMGTGPVSVRPRARVVPSPFSAANSRRIASRLCADNVRASRRS